MGELRVQVLRELHATPLGGHFGRDKTLALVRSSVWWSGLPTAVEEFVQTCPTCQRVKADHLPPAGLIFPLPVPTRRWGSISLDFLELPTARSGHDLLQVHINLLTGRVWLIPTFKTATAETAARNFVSSVFHDVGVPDVLVSDRDTRFTSAFWTWYMPPWAPLWCSARPITATPRARWSASMVSSPTSCAPSPTRVATTGQFSCRWSNSPSIIRRRLSAPATLPSMPTAASTPAARSPRPRRPTPQDRWATARRLLTSWCA
jgi:hypothetical protein